MNLRSGTTTQTGFTLVELTIVLIIVALLSTGMMFGVSAQRNIAENTDAQRQLENIRESLHGFAISNGRLPCPALPNLPNTDPLAGVASTPPCPNALQYGVLPWVTLGLPETDPWGNRYTYFVSDKFTAAVISGNLASFSLASGIFPDNDRTATIKDANTNNIALEIPAVVVSHGSRAAGAYQTSGGQLAVGSGDEAENSDADLTFVSHTPTDSYDDLVIWIVPSILKSRMVAAGRLP